MLMKCRWLLLVVAFVPFLLGAGAQSGSNIITGLSGWKAVLLAPDPTFRTGVDGIHDQWCQAATNQWNTDWAGWQNQAMMECFAVPNATTGSWLSGVNLTGYTGHVSSQWFAGYSLLVEGQRLNGIETTNRIALWDYGQQRTLFWRDWRQPNKFFFGEFVPGKELDVEVTGVVRATVVLPRGNSLMCDSAQRGKMRFLEGADGVRDTVQFCGKASTGSVGWRTMY